VSPQEGTAFGMIRDPLLGSPVPLPCNPPPWGVLAAVDLNGGKIVWEATLGTIEEYTGGLLALPWGTPSLGGPIVTRSGVVFIGAAMDRYLRAFDIRDGRELWQGRLPATAQATPMTYMWHGEQFIVIAAGGYPDAGIVAPNDKLVAFRLPRSNEAGPTLWSRTIDRPGGRGWATLAIVLLIVPVLVRTIWRWRRRRTCALPNSSRVAKG
jgi:quinoprotein glucose dehydrogenase